MKKSLVTGLSLLALCACSEVRSPDLCSMVGLCRNPKPDVKYVDVRTEEKVNYVNVEAPVEATCAQVNSPCAGAAHYQLPKRGERYASADYVITPEVYSILASRVAGKVLEDSPALFVNNPNAPIYIADMVQIDRYLPDGPNSAGQTAREILVNSKMFNIVDDPQAADYIFESSLTNSNTPEVPVISYEMRLMDRNGNMLNSWSDTVRQVQNDDGSWW